MERNLHSHDREGLVSLIVKDLTERCVGWHPPGLLASYLHCLAILGHTWRLLLRATLCLNPLLCPPTRRLGAHAPRVLAAARRWP